MADFGMVKSFQIDNGELDGLTAQEIFVLGYELAQIDQLVKTTSGGCLPVHANNQRRIRSACEDAERNYKLSWMTDDVSETWMMLELVPK